MARFVIHHSYSHGCVPARIGVASAWIGCGTSDSSQWWVLHLSITWWSNTLFMIHPWIQAQNSPKQSFPTLLRRFEFWQFSKLRKTNIKKNYSAAIHFSYSLKGKVAEQGCLTAFCSQSQRNAVNRMRRSSKCHARWPLRKMNRSRIVFLNIGFS